MIGGKPARARQIAYVSVLGFVGTCCYPALRPDPPHPPDGPPKPPPTATVSVPPPEPPKPTQCRYLPPRASRGARTATRIVGGKPAQFGAWPSVAAVATADRRAFCTATIIRPSWGLTAAHCQPLPGESLLVGHTDLARADQAFITESRIHAEYDAATNDNDVAVVRLEQPVSVEPVGIAELPWYPEAPDAIAVGWGATHEGGSMVQHLREVSVPRWEWDDCRDAYSTLTPRQTCAGTYGRDSCQGDSGGPLFVFAGTHWEQIGVTSFGYGCAREGYPGVYAALFDAELRGWVERCAR